MDSSFAPNLPTADPIPALVIDESGRMIVGTFATGQPARLSRVLPDGTMDPSFNVSIGYSGASGGVLRLLQFANGDILVAGRFTTVNGRPINALARVRPDGSVDPSFNAQLPADAIVAAIALATDGQLYVGGLFSQIGGGARQSLARLTPGGSLDLTFDAGNYVTRDFANLITAILPQDKRLHIAGTFYDGEAILATLGPDGQLLDNTSYARSPASVNNALVLLPNGKLMLGTDSSDLKGWGDGLTTSDSSRRINLNRFKTYCSGVGLSNPGSIECILAYADGRVLAGGVFTNVVIDGYYDPSKLYNQAGVARLDPSFKFDPTFDVGGMASDRGYPSVNAMAFAPDGSIVIAGEFSSVGGLARRNLARLRSSAEAPVLLQQPQAQGTVAGNSVRLSVKAWGTPPLRYAWSKDGAPLPGETRADLGIAQATTAPTLNTQTLAYYPAQRAIPGSLANLSTRGLAAQGQETLIVGFVLRPEMETMRTLVRGVGPSLQRFGVTRFVNDPRLLLFRGSDLIATNDEWQDDGPGIAALSSELGAFELDPGSHDAAMQPRLPAGAFTAHVQAGASAVALAELYRTWEGNNRLLNVSSRALVGNRDNVLIGGFVITGGPKRIMIRAVGPALEQFGLTGVLGDPRLRVMQGDRLVAENDDWDNGGNGSLIASAGARLGAFALTSGSRDAAWLGNLPSGAYTAIVSGSDGGGGVALVEIYDADP